MKTDDCDIKEAEKDTDTRAFVRRLKYFWKGPQETGSTSCLQGGGRGWGRIKALRFTTGFGT